MPEALQEVKAEAQEGSSGPYKMAELRRKPLDSPYAKRHARPVLDPGVINIQTGLFWRSWKVQRAKQTKDGAAGAVINDAPYAQFLEEGTKTMFKRPIVERTIKNVTPTLRKIFQTAIAKALK